MALTIDWSSQTSTGKPQYSDHAPIWNANVFSWNMMNQCVSAASRTNNGFGVTESDSDYQNRLTRVANVIASAVKQQQIDIIALQEAPKKSSPHFQYFVGQLQRLLGRHFVIASQYADDTPQTSSSRLTIFNGKRFKATNVTHTHTLKLGQQHERVQVIEFTEGKNKPFLFANVHLAFGVQPQTAISSLLNNDVILAGDLNCDVSHHLRDRSDLVNRVVGANFSFDVRNNRKNTPTHYDTIVLPRPIVSAQATHDHYAVYVRETLSPDMAAHFCGYQPPPAAHTHQSQQMGELVFRNQTAANAILTVLKSEQIVTNSHKRTFTNARGEFTIPLGSGEAARLRQHAERLAPIAKPVREVKKAQNIRKAATVKPVVTKSLVAKPITQKPVIVKPSIAQIPPQPKQVPLADVPQAEAAVRRKLFHWLGHKNTAFLKHPLMLTAAVLGMGMLYALGFTFMAITAASASYAALYALSRFSTKVNEQAMLCKTDPAVWKNNHQVAYELGEKAKHWAPYLQSFVRPAAYSSAYQVGLMNAQEEVNAHKKCSIG